MSAIVNDNVHAEACFCGKCIKRRHKKSNFSVYPYSKDIESTYNLYFKEKQTDRSLPPVFVKSMLSSLDLGQKQNHSSGLFSTQKFDYRPFKVEPHEQAQPKNPEKVPFIGSSSYSNAFIDWKVQAQDRNSKVQYIDTNVPLRGSSNYKEAYLMNSDYKRILPCKPISHLELSGAKFQTIPLYREEFKSSDLKNLKPYLAKKLDKNTVEKSFMTTNTNKSLIFKSSYSYDFTKQDINKNKCLMD
jgi:hypothetical protein